MARQPDPKKRRRHAFHSVFGCLHVGLIVVAPPRSKAVLWTERFCLDLGGIYLVRSLIYRPVPR